MRFFSFITIVIVLIISCKPIYKSTEFNLDKTPHAPDYSQKKSWAVLPNNYPESLEKITEKYSIKNTDIFYIYPTLLTDKKDDSWNANIWDIDFRNEVINKAILNQASSWVKSGNLYAPLYRQAHYRIFNKKYTQQGKKAWEIAYNDIRNSFEYYLKNYNMGKPIIIAAHSQGSIHGKKLIQEFFDEKPLQKKLIAAYLIGTRIKPEEFKQIKHMTQKDEIGGYITWNTYKDGKYPKNYNSWFKGGSTSNPITWDSKTVGPISLHKGVLYEDKKIYPNSVSVKVINGLLWSSLPKIPKRLLLSTIKSYHFADINLFWKDIEENSVLRVDKWFEKNKTP
jgi:hypothetical protein